MDRKFTDEDMTRPVGEVCHLIGICGPMGAGKTEVARLIEEKRQHTTRHSFAGNLKIMTARLFDWEPEMLEGDSSSSRFRREVPCDVWSERIGRPFTPREAMQQLGTEFFRRLNPDIWVNMAMKGVDMVHEKNPGTLAVMQDVRFPNEAAAIKKRGGMIIYVHGRRVPYHVQEGGGRHPAELHQSENSLTGFKVNYGIMNCGNLAHLGEQVDRLLGQTWGDLMDGMYDDQVD